MSPQAIALASDAIKILGPAAIAAYATYRASKVQIDIKLKELDKVHEFRARQSLFEHYRDKQKELDKAYEELANEIGQSLGYMSADPDGPSDSEFRSMLAGLTQLYSRMGPLEIEATARDMRAKGLADTDEFALLMACCERMKQPEDGTSNSVIQKNSLMILEAYDCLRHCNHMLLASQIEGAFSKYTQG